MGSFEISIPYRLNRINFPGNSLLTAPSPMRTSIMGESNQIPNFPVGVGIPFPILVHSRMKQDDSTSLGSRSLTNCCPSILRTLAPAPLNFSDQETFCL